MTELVNLAFSNYGDKDWDRLVIWEHDMIVPDQALNPCPAAYPSDHDVVGSLYFQHSPPHAPMAYMRVGEYGFSTIAPASVQHMVDNPALYPVDAVGFGFTAISRRLLEEWDKSVRMFHSDPAVDLGHDLWFCLKAKEQGFTVAVDSGMACGHLSTLSVGLADHQRYPVDAGKLVVWEAGQVSPFNPTGDSP